MKSLIYAGVAASVLVVPIASVAQSYQPLTRAQVRAELIELEQAGYKPVVPHGDINYPARIQAAEARVAAQRKAQSDQ